MKKRAITRAGWTAGGMLLLAALLPATGRAGDTTAFSWTVASGTCDVTLDPATLALGEVDPTPLLGQSYKIAGEKDLHINLTCNGLFKGKKPVVTISGEFLPVAANPGFIFRSAGEAGGTSRGLGFIFKKDNKNAGNNNDVDVKNNETLYIPKESGGYYEANESLTGTHSIHLKVGLGCGRPDWCTSSGLKAGTVNAKATFTFSYQ